MIAGGLEYHEQGTGEIPILCLHGIGGNTASFAPQLDTLSKSRRVIALNLPGYGSSPLLTETTFPNLANQVRDFMAAIGVQKAHLCGHSIGGMIALEIAALHPECVASLALIATTSAFGGRDESFKEAFVAARLAPLDQGKTLAELAGEFVPEITGPNVSHAAITSAKASMAAVSEETYRAIIACLVTFDRRSLLDTLKVPTCLISGELDQNAPAKTMARMAEKITDAEFHEIRGAGHLVNLEAPEETNAILDAFYRRIT